LGSTGESHRCKKHKLNVSVNDYTHPSPNKAIQQKKIEVNNNLTSGVMQENISKNLEAKKLSLIITMCLMTPPMF
jgi:hypothetical protein